jgi:transcriptional regulator with XRE-family HTH domain
MAAIRADLGLLMPKEIKAIRESLDLSQADFELLLGVGQKTVVRWEKGTVFQNRATDTLLRALRDVPGVAEYLGARTGVSVPMPVPPSGVPSEILHFDLSPEELQALLQFDFGTHDLIEKDQFVVGLEHRAYSVETGWFRRAA